MDKVYEFTPDDIDEEFKSKNETILSAKKGNGYWLWKPYFIDRVLSEIQSGDWIVYADCGLFYQNSVREYISALEKNNIYGVCHKSSYKETLFTKRDAFVLMGLDMEAYTDSCQRGGILALQKNDNNINMVKEWLHFGQDERIITDMPNTCGLDNYEGFIDHRHDQSILSLVSKKYGISEDYLYDSFANRKTSKAILCYHHTRYGSICKIAFQLKLDQCPLLHQFVRRVVMILKHMRLIHD